MYAAKGPVMSATHKIITLLLEAGADIEAVDEVRTYVCTCEYMYVF